MFLVNLCFMRDFVIEGSLLSLGYKTIFGGGLILVVFTKFWLQSLVSIGFALIDCL